jgi:glycosyltransferase involved in cell wall biosynthesis
MAKQGHSCVMIASDSNHLVSTPDFDGPYLDETIEGVRVVRLRALKYKASRSSGIGRVLSWVDFEWRTYRYSKDVLPPPSVVIASSLSLLTILTGLLLRRRYKCRLAFEVRDIWPLTLVEEAGFSAANPMIRLLGLIEKLGYVKADYIVGTMPNLGEHVAEVTGKKLPVGFIPMGIEEDWRERQKDIGDAYVAEHIPSDKFVVGYAGTIGVTNALETLFACVREMRDRPDIHFLIVGNGYLKEQYRTACADLPNISFAPAVPKAMVQSVLSRCDLLYFAAHQSKVWKYGQSLNKIMDYMLSGKPVVGSYTGFPSMLNEAGSGSYVPSKDARALRDEILRYAAMPAAERERMGAAGRDWILANRPYAKLAEDYVRLLSGPSNRRAAAGEA